MSAATASPAALAAAQRILDAAARRLLAEQIEGEREHGNGKAKR